LYTKPFELVIEIVFQNYTMPPCHKINLFKRPFRGSRFERLDDALVLLISLIFLYPIFLYRRSSRILGDLSINLA